MGSSQIGRLYPQGDCSRPVKHNASAWPAAHSLDLTLYVADCPGSTVASIVCLQKTSTCKYQLLGHTCNSCQDPRPSSTQQHSKHIPQGTSRLGALILSSFEGLATLTLSCILVYAHYAHYQQACHLLPACHAEPTLDPCWRVQTCPGTGWWPWEQCWEAPSLLWGRPSGSCPTPDVSAPSN